jgi:hypothetical protein
VVLAARGVPREVGAQDLPVAVSLHERSYDEKAQAEPSVGLRRYGALEQLEQER